MRETHADSPPPPASPPLLSHPPSDTAVHADHAAERQRISDIVSAAKRGDRAALTVLHHQFAPIVHAVLLTRVPHHDANDLAQDVFMQAMRKIHTLHDPAAVGPWLMTIARRAAADHLRHRKPVARLDESVPAPESNGSQLDLTDRARVALNAIRSLPEAYRETLVLRLVENLTGPQIAARTGLSPGSVRVNLHRGMHLLRAALNKAGDE